MSVRRREELNLPVLIAVALSIAGGALADARPAYLVRVTISQPPATEWTSAFDSQRLAQRDVSGSYGSGGEPPRAQVEARLASAVNKLQAALGTPETRQRGASTDDAVAAALKDIREAREIVSEAQFAAPRQQALGWPLCRQGMAFNQQAPGPQVPLADAMNADRIMLDNKANVAIFYGLRYPTGDRHSPPGKLLERKLLLADGEEGMANVGRDRTYHFLEQIGPTSYRLREVTVPEGIRCRVKVTGAQAEDQARLELTLENTRVVGRRKLSALAADMARVGRPIVRQRSVSTELAMTLGQNVLFVLPEGRDESAHREETTRHAEVARTMSASGATRCASQNTLAVWLKVERAPAPEAGNPEQ